MNERLLTVQEVCEVLQVARGFVYRHAKEMAAVKVGSHLRFRRSGLDRWIESQQLAGDEPWATSLRPGRGPVRPKEMSVPPATREGAGRKRRPARKRKC
ncbi:MAG: helix-turn-helix domain-containing protein [Chloroflexi bacterium]|nr:helix-turn-helix domain-containing protein [Chloroflexota bacterium]